MSVLDELYAGDLRSALLTVDGSWSRSPDLSGCIVLAGSFNPLHEGHMQIAKIASEITDRRVVFEISIENVDKPDLPRPELEQRLSQFTGVGDVAVTRARLFSDKAALLPGAWFVIGFDTAVRLLDDRYHSDGDAEADVRKLSDAGVKFVVAGRVDNDGVFRGLKDIDIPQNLGEMFIEVSESAFRSDISSTELRKRGSR